MSVAASQMIMLPTFFAFANAEDAESFGTYFGLRFEADQVSSVG